MHSKRAVQEITRKKNKIIDCLGTAKYNGAIARTNNSSGLNDVCNLL